MIPESFIEELKYQSDIEGIVSSYVALKRRGRNLTGLCPFHSEKTPSFTVYPDNGSYYCFGCGSGGDVITFVRNIENLEYLEALKFLADKAGMSLPEDAADDKAARRKSRILELNREAARYFYRNLAGEQGGEARRYLAGRGLTGKTIKRFGMGYALPGWDGLLNHLKGKGFSIPELEDAAVVSRGRNGGYYDLFRERIIFPIIDLRGNVIGFGGRALGDRGPKYLNSPDSPVFKKSRNLFALNFAKAVKSDQMILAEGYLDVIAMHQAGFENAVATLGTALTSEQSRLISSYAKTVVIAYDSDEAGQKATGRAINLLGELDVAVNVLEITGAKDPDEYIKKYGAGRFQQLLGGGKGAVQFEVDKLRARFDLDSVEGKSAFLNEFCKFIAGIDSDIQRDVYSSEVARELSVGKDAILTTVEALRKKRKKTKELREAHNLKVYVQDKPDAERNPHSIEGMVAEEKLLALLMQHPDCYDQIRGRLTVDDYQSETNRAIFAAVTGRLEQRQTPELIHLSGVLDTRQMSRLSQLLAANRDIRFLPEQADAFCQAILAQKNRKTKDEIGKMSREEYLTYMASEAAKKK